jgi:hypothetical protein
MALSLARPDHAVLVTMENHSYSESVGSSSAPFINNTLAMDGLPYAGASATAPVPDISTQSNHLKITSPASATAGSSFSITVTAQDANNNTLTSYLGTIHFTSSDAAAVLPSNYTFTAADAGVHTFAGVILKTAGSRSITATDTVTSSITRSVSVTVSPAAAASLVVAGFPSPVTAGTTNNFTVTVKDPYGNTVSGYTGTVKFSSSASKAVLPANYTFTGADAGVHTFSAILKSAGTQSLTAKDSLNSGISGSQKGIVVNPAATNHLKVSRFPSSTTAAVSQTFRVTAQDIFGNTTPNFADTVSFSSSDGQAVLPANYTFTSADAGVHTFTGTLKTAGKQSITAQDVTNAVIGSGTESSITVNPAAANHLQVSGFPSSVIAGTVNNFTVSAVDPYGNIASGYRGTLKFSTTDPQAVLPANYPFTSSDAGVHTFSATLNTQGSQSITATDSVNASITGTDSDIAVASAQPGLNPSLPPSGNFNLTTWNLTLPTGTAGHPDVIPTKTLDTGYTSQYFYTGSDGAMTFWCPVTGVTTSGSSYPRTELRETKPDGTLYNWNVLDGTATLSATLAVNQVPSTGKIVIGQIHDNGAGGIKDEPLIKLVYEYNSTTGTAAIVAQIRSTPTSSNTDYTLATGIKLNTQFSYQIQLRSDLTLSVQINGVTQYSKPIDPIWESQGLYFKAGAYVQDNVGTSTEGGKVSFYALTVTHG